MNELVEDDMHINEAYLPEDISAYPCKVQRHCDLRSGRFATIYIEKNRQWLRSRQIDFKVDVYHWHIIKQHETTETFYFCNEHDALMFSLYVE